MKNQRRKTTIMFDRKRNAIHFNDAITFPIDLWIAVDSQLSLFENIEKIMMAYKVANNCTDIEVIRNCGDTVDYEIIYNIYNPYN